MSSGVYPEIAAIMVQAGRPDDGTDPGSFNNVEFFVPLAPGEGLARGGAARRHSQDAHAP